MYVYLPTKLKSSSNIYLVFNLYEGNGPLLRMAENVAKRILPAFDTRTGMPYGTVNLKYGVPENETT